LAQGGHGLRVNGPQVAQGPVGSSESGVS